MSDERRLIGPYQPDVDDQLEQPDLEPEAWVDAAEYAALGHQLDHALQKLARITALCAERAEGAFRMSASFLAEDIRAILADPGTDPEPATSEADPWTSPIPLEGSTP